MVPYKAVSTPCSIKFADERVREREQLFSLKKLLAQFGDGLNISSRMKLVYGAQLPWVVICAQKRVNIKRLHTAKAFALPSVYTHTSAK